MHTCDTSDACFRRRDCVSTLVSGLTLVGPEHNLESSLDDLREAARLMPTSAVLVLLKLAVLSYQAKMLGTEIRSCLHKCKELLHKVGPSVTHKKSDRVGRCSLLVPRP